MINSSERNNFLNYVCIYGPILDPDNSTSESNTGFATQKIFTVSLSVSVTWFT